MSTESQVMALLEEGNPATELPETAWSGTTAAAYLATLNQRSSEVTQLDTRTQERTQQRRRPARLVLVAAAVLIAALGALLILTDNDSDVVGDIETTGTSICGPVEQIDHSERDFEGIQQCTNDSSDDRLDGTGIFSFSHAGDAAWQGTVEIVNDGGAWTGTFFGTESNGVNTARVELVGSGGYEGLTYVGTSTGPDTPDGAATFESTGVISSSD